MKTISIHEVKTHLSRYLAAIEENGEEFIIARGKRPVARLIPLSQPEGRPRPKVGEMVSEPGDVPDEAIRPFNEEGLAEWGL